MEPNNQTRANPEAVNFGIILGVLAVFTFLEAAITYLASFPASLKAGVLIFLAIVKAALVLLYFMHLRFDRRIFALPFVLGMVLIIPLWLLVGLTTPTTPTSAEAAGGVTAGAEARGLSATGQVIDVTEVSFRIHMSQNTVSAGPVTFHIVNGANDMLHEFIIIQTDSPAGELPTDMTGRVQEDAVTIITAAEDIPPAGSRNITVNLGAGHYVMICNLPGHYLQGMQIDFNVTGTSNEPPSTPESTPQPQETAPAQTAPAVTSTPGT